MKKLKLLIKTLQLLTKNVLTIVYNIAARLQFYETSYFHDTGKFFGNMEEFECYDFFPVFLNYGKMYTAVRQRPSALQPAPLY